MKKDSLSYSFLSRTPKFLISDPYEAFFSISLAISGMADLLYPKKVGVIGHYLPTWQGYIWGTILVVGSALTLMGLIGSSKSGTLKTLRKFREYERIGQLILAVGTIIWSVVIFSLGPAFIASGILTLSFSAMFLVKSVEIKGLEEYLTKVDLSKIKELSDD